MTARRASSFTTDSARDTSLTVASKSLTLTEDRPWASELRMA
jgi:hypothetical protein